MSSLSLSSPLLRLATTIALVGLVGCGSPPAPVAATPRLRADQCIDEVSRAVVTRGDAHSHCESDSSEDAFTAGPSPNVPPTVTPANDAPAPRSTLARDIALGTAGLAVVGGSIYCAVKCPDPWDTAVPATVGGALALTLVIAIATADWSWMGSFR